MLLLFLLLYLGQGLSSKAAPLSLLGANDHILSLRDATLPCTCPDAGQRSVWEILWSCLMVTFTCSWVSVHPDIPAPGESWKRSTVRRVEYMVWTVLTPELIIFWAARQFVGARRIAREQHEHQWTTAHGHFLQMGGFMLFDGKKAKGVLSYVHFQQLLEEGRIEFPEITVEEIKDRGKSDGLGKTLVIAQTGWFILQCISRKAQGLDLTEIELATFAFAALNVCFHFFWWNKPFDVHTSVPVRLLPIFTPDEVWRLNKDQKVDTVEHHTSEIYTPYNQSVDSILSQTPRQSLEFRDWTPLTIFNWPSHVLEFFGRRLFALVSFKHHKATKFEKHDISTSTEANAFMRVPTFYSTLAYSVDFNVFIWVLPVIASFFGAIHCAGWFFHFPSTAELWIWRISALSITVMPLIIFLFAILAAYISDVRHAGRFLSGISSIMFSIYFAARLTLLAEAFAALRNLPPDALVVVEWTSYIPHIS